MLVRWTHPAMPPARTLGVNDLVVSWNASAAPLLEVARNLGYRVYAEATPPQASAAAEAATKGRLAGVVLDVDDSERDKLDDTLRKLRTAYPNLTFLILSSQGKQPQIRKRLVVNKDEVVQVSSPTSQPWVDSNLALVRIERAFRPAQSPLYSFQWELTDPSQKQPGLSAADYSLAVAEAGAFHADLILNLPENLQRGLVEGDAGAGATWNPVKRYLEFWLHGARDVLAPLAHIGVVTDGYGPSYEPINLMARHNIQFRVVRSAELKAHCLDGLDMIVVFAAPGSQPSRVINDFAAQGGIAILVNLRGVYPWHSATPASTGEHSVAYSVGKGRVIELSEPVTDPETFARDVRRLMDKQKVLISLWNALTTVVALYREPGDRETILELVNYAEEPLSVQVQMKGSWVSIRYETPERGCCDSLTPTQNNGFTEFVVPELVIGGRVHRSSVADGARAGAVQPK